MRRVKKWGICLWDGSAMATSVSGGSGDEGGDGDGNGCSDGKREGSGRRLVELGGGGAVYGLHHEVLRSI